MKIGVSTACFYPERTIEALENLVVAGVKDVEVFFNTDSETLPENLERMMSIVANGGSNICAVHPYHCAFDWFYLFTGYDDRVNDGVAMYERFFESVRFLGVSIVTIHGEHRNSSLSTEKSAEILKRLIDSASRYGISLCIENVARNKLRTVQDIINMRELFDDNIAFTIDVKQAKRCEQSPIELIDAAGKCLKHVHISADTAENDCVLPNTSDAGTIAIMQHLKNCNYNGHVIIELYRNGFKNTADIISAYHDLCSFA